MFHPQVTRAQASALESAYRRTLRPLSVDEALSWSERLSSAVDEKGQPLRPLTSEERAIIENELLLTKVDFAYGMERYAHINAGGHGVARATPLFDSQYLILDELAALELKIHEGERDDGILINLLKARQLGCSTLWELLGVHRHTTQNHVFGLIASDVPDTSAYLFDMFELAVDRLPWYLRPSILERVKNSEILFDGGSHVWMGSGKSTRGTEGRRGQLGRARTLSWIHLSEVSTWEAPEQIDDALLPTIPRSPRTLVGLESTAKGRNNWWHQHWKLSFEPESRFHNIFIPWFAEPRKYRASPPSGWEPSSLTLAHRDRCQATGPRWLHRPVRLTREQLYWYESTRAYYEKRDQLSMFLEEYAADDDEAFQFSGSGVFPADLIEKHERLVRPLFGAYEIAPMARLV